MERKQIMTQGNNNKPKASDKLLQRAKEFEKKLKTAKTVDEKMELVCEEFEVINVYIGY